MNCNTSGLTLIIPINHPEWLHYTVKLLFWNRHLGWKNERNTFPALAVQSVRDEDRHVNRWQEWDVIKAVVEFCTEGEREAQIRGGPTSWRCQKRLHRKEDFPACSGRICKNLPSREGRVQVSSRRKSTGQGTKIKERCIHRIVQWQSPNFRGL